MQWTAADIASWLNGEVEGNPDKTVSHPAPIETAGTDHFSFIANPKYVHHIYTSSAGIVLVKKNFKPEKSTSATLIRVDDPYLSFAILLQKIADSKQKKIKGVSQLASVHSEVNDREVYIGDYTVIEKGCTLHKDVMLYPHVYIGENCTIGTNTVIYPGVKIYADTVIGKNCIIHANVVIGSDGFGFAPKKDGSFQKIPQVGNVEIADDVEIGANTVIDRGTIGSTRIAAGTKIDNLVQLAHNVVIGRNTVIAAQAGISGSTEIGNFCMIGGQAGFVGHIKIADQSKVNAQSGVSKSIKKSGTAVTGSPAFDYMDSLRAQAVMRRLPELEKKIEALEQKLNRKTAD